MMATDDNDRLNRRSSPSENSDPNNSFLRKVTSRVSGFIPSSLSKWFGPGDVIPAVIRSREPDTDDDSLAAQPPPKKRAKNTDVPVSNSLTSTLSNSRSERWFPQPGPSGMQDTYSARCMSMPQVNGDEKSDSEDSTSGYSSTPVQQNKECSASMENVNEPQPSTSKLILNQSCTTPSHSRSMFDSTLTSQKSCMSSRKPSFNASVFGTPGFIDRTLSTKRVFSSPFYGGRTTFGGASSVKRPRIFTREDSKPVIQNSVDIKPVNEPSNENVSLSKVARRILDTLEHFSSPVLDAKKIPNVNRPAGMQTPYKKHAPTRGLVVPTVPELLKMKQREKLQDSTVSVRNVAVNSKSVLNTRYSPVPEKEARQKHVNKMKSKVISMRDHKQESDIVEAPALPDVQLPITTLPKFDFSLPPPPAAVKTDKTIKSPITKSNVMLNPTDNSVPTVLSESTPQKPTEFKFASPIIVEDAPKSVVSINNFEFSQPINVKSQNEASVMTFKSSSLNTAPRRKETKNNGQNTEVTFSLQPASQLVSGSVMDILGKPKDKVEQLNLMDKFKPAAGSWECSACMVRNKPDASRCVACETPKEVPVKTDKTSGFGNQFKMSSDNWECSVCMVRNSNVDTKCAACTNPKAGPSVKPATPKASASVLALATPVLAAASPSGFGDKFKPATGTWECGVCMIRNKSDDVKCVACETVKPGAEVKKSTLVMPEVKPTGPGFGDLIKKDQGKWECGSCMVRNEPDSTKCVCCETPKPGCKPETSTSGPVFKFGTSPNSTGFTFGVNKTETSTPSTFTFGIAPKSEDKTVTTQSFSFGIPAISTPESKPATTFKFVPVKADVNKVEDAKPTVSDTGIFGKVTASAVSTVSTVASTKSMFTFSTSSTEMKNSTVSSSSALFGIPYVASTSVNTVFDTKPLSTPANVSSSFLENKSTSFTAPVTTVTITTSTVPSFVQTASPDKPTPTFGTQFTVPQFSFGSNNLPFPVSKPEAVFTSSLPSTAVKPNTTSTVTSQSFTQQGSSGVTKSEPKPFSFGSNAVEPPAKAAVQFTFTGNGGNSSPAKPAVFSFGNTLKQEAPKAASSQNLFSFGASNAPAFCTPKTEQSSFSSKPDPIFGAQKSGGSLSKSESAFGAPKPAPPNFGASPSGSSMFGNIPPNVPQNGGFNFGAASSTPNFNFGGNAPAAPTAVFGFGSGQVSSSNTGFSMGSTSQVSSFNFDVKPNFNFTAGSAPSFSAQNRFPGQVIQNRKMRKAVRRTQMR